MAGDNAACSCAAFRRRTSERGMVLVKPNSIQAPPQVRGGKVRCTCSKRRRRPHTPFFAGYRRILHPQPRLNRARSTAFTADDGTNVEMVCRVTAISR